MRKVVAQRMYTSAIEIPTVTQTVKVDVTKLLAFRKELNEGREQRLSLNDFILKAVAKALRRNPQMLVSLDGDQIISNWVMSMGIGKWGAFAIMMAIVFVLGMFIDWLGIVMIVFPIFLPIMDQFGFDRLWLVALTAVLLQTCFMTPPFGFALFYVKGILPDTVKIQEVYKGVIPFILIIIIVTVLCAVFPQLVTWLPTTMAAGA